MKWSTPIRTAAARWSASGDLRLVPGSRPASRNSDAGRWLHLRDARRGLRSVLAAAAHALSHRAGRRGRLLHRGPRDSGRADQAADLLDVRQPPGDLEASLDDAQPSVRVGRDGPVALRRAVHPGAFGLPAIHVRHRGRRHRGTGSRLPLPLCRNLHLRTVHHRRHRRPAHAREALAVAHGADPPPDVRTPAGIPALQVAVHGAARNQARLEQAGSQRHRHPRRGTR